MHYQWGAYSLAQVRLDAVGNHLPQKPLSLHFGMKDNDQKGASSKQKAVGGQIHHKSDRHQVVWDKRTNIISEKREIFTILSVVR